jgi:hypothetical protein
MMSVSVVVSSDPNTTLMASRLGPR